MSFFSRHRGAVIASAAALLVLAMAISSFFTKGRTSPVSSAINFIFRPLHNVVGAISDRVGGMVDYTRKYDDLLAENEHLKAKIAQMEEQERISRDAIEENERLRTLLNLPLAKREFQYAAATVIERNVSSWAKTLTLSKGTEHGIEVGKCVVSADGNLVGIISQAGANWSIVTTIIDTDMSAGALIDRTGQAAIAEGEWSLMREGRLKLALLPLESDVQNGDLILTSGLGGVYPKDIPIGTVVGMQPEPTGQTAYAVIEPRVKLDELSQVFVVLSYTVEE